MGDEIIFSLKISFFFLAEVRASTYVLDQERQFERMMEALENSQSQQQASLLNIDPEVEAFVNGIAYLLQKVTGQQREKLFIDTCQLIYDRLFPWRQTALHPAAHSAQGAEPHLPAFRPPCTVATPTIPTGHGDQTQFGCNWIPPSAIEGESNAEYSCTLQYTEL